MSARMQVGEGAGASMGRAPVISSPAIAALAFEEPARSQGRDALEAAQHHGSGQLDQQATKPATDRAELRETGGRGVRPGRRERVRVLEPIPVDDELVESGAAR